jgi:hypothetical protein
LANGHGTQNLQIWHEILTNCRLKSFVRSLKTVYLYFTKTLVRNFGHWPRNTNLQIWHEILANGRLKSFGRSLKTVYLYFTKTLARNFGQWPRNAKCTDLARNFNQWPAEILRQKPQDSIPVFYYDFGTKFWPMAREHKIT